MNDRRSLNDSLGGLKSVLQKKSRTKRTKSVRFTSEVNVAEIIKSYKDCIVTSSRDIIWSFAVFNICMWSTLVVTMIGFLEPKSSHDSRFYCKEPAQEVNWTNLSSENICAPEKLDKTSLKNSMNNTFILRNFSTDFIENISKEFGNLPLKNCNEMISRHGFHNENFPSEDGCYNIHAIVMYVNLSLTIMVLLFMGIGADVYGRKRLIQINVAVCVGGLFLYILATKIWIIIVSRAMAYVGSSAVWYFSYICFAEICSKKYRPILLHLLTFGCSLGCLMAMLINRYITNAAAVKASYALVSLVLPFGAWYLPESPRWLLAHRNFLELEKVLHEMGASDIPQHQSVSCKIIQPNLRYIFKVFRKYQLRNRICSNIFSYVVIFGSINKVYVLQGVPVFQHQMVLSCFLFFSAPIAIILVYFLGRKLCLSFLFLLMGILYCFMISDDEIILFGCSLFIMGLLTAALNTAMLQTSEMFPVSHMGMIMCLCVSCGEIFYMCMFSLDYLVNERYHLTINFPALIKVLLNFTAACAVLSVPETTNVVVPLTQSEAQHLRYEIKRNMLKLYHTHR